MNEDELRREIVREQRIHDGRVERSILLSHCRLRYPYLYPLGDDEDDEDDEL